eukprot:TRINITY_DN916_c4_g1_i1.p1 TRINITY_DN916_c4_g1~~TRINITY_DN916_c4_g1_i1.p1  ORF type:complete len:157 (-),score=33.18 TRINITY_DN916_c4_g1_i1:41-511(-)
MINRFLQRMDHAMIFVLITGSYTPYCLFSLAHLQGIQMFIFVASIGVIGVLYKMLFFGFHPYISTAIYVGMGLLITLIFPSLLSEISPWGVFLLALGGAFYIFGGVIYALKPRMLQKNRNWRSHEVFHIFILLGSASHFISVYFYVFTPAAVSTTF